MNRAGAAVVDNAIRQGKGDVTKLVGRENVGDAWDIIEVNDLAIVLNNETKMINGKLQKYIVFSVVKRRNISSVDPSTVCNYMVHPFVDNSLKLADDLYLNKSLSLKSLASDLDALKEKTNATERLKNGRYDFEDYTD